MSENTYEKFRNQLAVNLCMRLSSDKLKDVLGIFDVTMKDYDISRKEMSIVPYGGVPDVVKYFIASKSINNCSMKTLKQYKYKLINFFNTVKKSFSEITPIDIRLYLNHYKVDMNAGDRYRDNIRITLNGFFQWLVDNDYLQKNPCKNVEKIKFKEFRREPLTSIQLENVRWNTVNLREKALIDFLFSTGLRVSECADVKLSDIDWNLREVHVRNGKGGKERFVYFNAEAELSMRKYIESRTDDVDGLFVSVRKPYHQITDHQLENIVNKIGIRSGIKIYPHKFRHTFATHGLRSGMSLEELQQLLGHSSPNTTLIYVKQDLTKLRIDHNRAYS